MITMILNSLPPLPPPHIQFELLEDALLQRAYAGLGVMLVIAIIASSLVFVAMLADLFAGWRKAKERGEKRNSHRLSRSIGKFLLYEGAMIIAICADTLIHFVWAMFQQSTYYFVPILSCLIAFLLCCVEIMSIREKADQKTRHSLDTSARTLAKALDKDALTDIIAEALKRSKQWQ